jgi:hypothetical protein
LHTPVGECTDAATGQIQAELPEPRYASSGEDATEAERCSVNPSDVSSLTSPDASPHHGQHSPLRNRVPVQNPTRVQRSSSPIIQRRTIAAAGHDQHSAVIRRPHPSRRSLTHQSRWPPGDQVADSTSIGGSTSRRSASARRCISASLDSQIIRT